MPPPLPNSSAAQHRRGVIYRELTHTLELVELSLLWRAGDDEPLVADPGVHGDLRVLVGWLLLGPGSLVAHVSTVRAPCQPDVDAARLTETAERASPQAQRGL